MDKKDLQMEIIQISLTILGFILLIYKLTSNLMGILSFIIMACLIVSSIIEIYSDKTGFYERNLNSFHKFKKRGILIINIVIMYLIFKDFI